MDDQSQYGELSDPAEAQRAIDLLNDVRQIQKERVGSFADETTDHGSAGDTSWSGRPPDSFEDHGLPDKIGRFEILDQIGQGGFARVFRARDPGLDREVALKIPNLPSMLSSEARERFEREAKSAALLSHPSIVPVFEFGSVGPISFISYEFCSGSTLAQWLDAQGGKTDPRLAAAIVAKMAEAVQHAHQRGVVHRDLKPGNVMLSGKNGETTDPADLRITDFGLARNIESADQSLTQEGSVVGTPAYMSPEQARGDRIITHSTDVWSLGIILYQLLTGKLPFKKDNHLSTLRAIENDTLTPPRKLDSAIPRDLNAICQRCLQKTISDRYANSFELQEDIEKWLGGRPVLARPVSTWQSLVRWSRRNPALSGALAFAITSLVVGLSLTSWKWMESNTNLAASVEQKNRAEKTAGLAQEVLRTVVSRVSDELANSPEYIDLRKKLAEDALVLQQQLLADEPDDADIQLETALAYRRLGNIQYESADVDNSIQSLESALDLMKRIDRDQLEASIQHIEATTRRDYISALSRLADDSRAALENDELFFELNDGYPDVTDVERNVALAKYWRMKANFLNSNYEFVEAIEALRTGLDELESGESGTPEAVLLRCTILNKLANNYMRTKEYEESRNVASECRLLMQNALLEYPDDWDCLEVLAAAEINLVECSLLERNVEQAQIELESPLKVLTKLRGQFPDHEHYAIDYFRMRFHEGTIIGYQFKNSPAASAAQKGNDWELLIRQVVDEYNALNPMLQRSPNVVVQVVRLISDWSEYWSYRSEVPSDPVPLLSEAIDMMIGIAEKEDFPAYRAVLAECYNSRSRALKLQRQDYHQAMASLIKSREIMEILVEEQRTIAILLTLERCYEDSSSVHYQLGNYDQALEFADKARDVMTEVVQQNPVFPHHFELYDVSRKWCLYSSSLGEIEAIDQRVETLLAGLPETAPSYVLLSDLYLRCAHVYLGRVDEAEIEQSDEEIAATKQAFIEQSQRFLEQAVDVGPAQSSIYDDSVAKRLNQIFDLAVESPYVNEEYVDLIEELRNNGTVPGKVVED